MEGLEEFGRSFISHERVELLLVGSARFLVSYFVRLALLLFYERGARDMLFRLEFGYLCLNRSSSKGWRLRFFFADGELCRCGV